MWILFEDAGGTDSCELIKLVYSGTDVHVGFVGGSGNFINYINEHSISNERVLIYYDLVPDNPSTASGYRNLRKKLRKCSNITIIPVICTEYTILKSLPVAVPSLKDVLLTTVYPTGVTSAEKYYKYFLDNNTKPCYALGRFCPIIPITGEYYRCDCKCSYVDFCVTLKRLNKSIQVNRCLPIVPGIGSLGPFGSNTIDKVINDSIVEHNTLVQLVAKKRMWKQQEINKATI